MKRTLAILAGVLALSAALPPTARAHETMRWGWSAPLETSYEDPACLSGATIWHQELGLSGITRLRAKFERRGPYDPGLPGLTYGSTGWMYSTTFPNTALSMWIRYRFYFRYPPNNLYSVRAVLIGERPSFWQPDRRLTAHLGEIICEESAPGFSWFFQSPRTAT